MSVPAISRRIAVLPEVNQSLYINTLLWYYLRHARPLSQPARFRKRLSRGGACASP